MYWGWFNIIMELLHTDDIISFNLCHTFYHSRCCCCLMKTVGFFNSNFPNSNLLVISAMTFCKLHHSEISNIFFIISSDETLLYRLKHNELYQTLINWIPARLIHHDDVIKGNIFRVTGHLWGEFTGPRWIPRTKASGVELWCFLWPASELTVE